MSLHSADAGLKSRPSVRVTYDEAHGGAVADTGGGAEMIGRVRLVLGAFLCVFCLLGVRLAYVSFGMEEEIALVRAANSSDMRAEVLDREGRPLIMNRDTYGLGIDGRDVWDVEETVAALTGLFPDIRRDWLTERLADGRYAYLRSDISETERAAVVALGLPGMRFPPGRARVYPQGELAGHVLGYTIPGRGGAVGIEKSLDGMDEAGSVRLTLDVAVQQVLEDEIGAAIETFSAKAGWGVLMDARTGDVVALASLPDYDPNRPGDSRADARRNRAVSDAYELGSAFKPITVAAAIEKGVVTQSERFDVSKPITVGRWQIEDYSRKPHPLTVSEVLQYSSNIGTIQIAQRLGEKSFVETLGMLGLTEPLKTDLPEARQPQLPPQWGEAELATASYGHGIAVTPLQLAAAFAAVVNGGTYVTPRFLEDTPVKTRPVFSPETSAALRVALRRVMTDGTGRNAEAHGYHAIGKTATADKPGGGGYNERKLISSFVGAFPGYDPQYVLLVSLDEPQGIAKTYGFATAGYTAAPIFRRVVERAAPTLGLMPVGDAVALDGFIGLQRGAGEPQDLDAMARLLTEAAL
ncbi:peptidoglycan D,D-transpeptidase FtsI family protein [Parvularcula oceani]|uniref:peptidoglycan D,D-transpeptidase FtsI family protein n=1 Tax=Parvularcula oceani TaxID=1247963 RepID=UPI000690A23A|nr:penicillin-binding protein 2 [Parvularcula oceani]